MHSVNKFSNKMLIAILLATALIQGCMVTKVVTVPLRITGAAVSVVPVVGDVVDGTLETTADVID